MTPFVLAARFFLGIVLLRSGLAKLSMDASRKGAAVSRYSLLPDRLSYLAAVTLIVTELGAALLLLVGIALRSAGLIGATLFAMFSCAIVVNLVRKRVFDCGCGANERLISWRLVGQDLLLCSVSLLVAGYPSQVLALWAGWGSTQDHESAISLLPVPMLTLLALVVSVVVIRGCQSRLFIPPVIQEGASR